MKALVLFSGGLDSILAVKLLEKQNIEVTGIAFRSYFFDFDQAQRSAKENGIELITIDISKSQWEIVKKPKFGHGSGLNPCIDCHALMLKTAYRVLLKNGFDILATGEVLGQRPMSQNKIAFQRIEKHVSLQGKILRPLSAKVLPETEYEKSGFVKRELLESISGRGRKKQIALAEEFRINHYPSPAGGCRLTEKDFSAKLKTFLDNVEKPIDSDFELLRIGRHFWTKAGHIILGKNKEENLELGRFSEKGDALIEREDKKGPTALIRPIGRNRTVSNNIFDEAKKIIYDYSKVKPNKWEELNFRIKNFES